MVGSTNRQQVVVFTLTCLFFTLTQQQVWSFSKNHSHNLHHHRGLTNQQQQQQQQHLQLQTNKSNNHRHHRHVLKNVSLLQMKAISTGGGAAVEPPPPSSSTLDKLQKIIQKNSFLLGMACAVSFAKAFPSLGVNGGIMKPELLIGKFGVCCIFLLSGVSLELSELKEALTNFKLNTLVQLGSFLAWPFLVGVPLVGMIKRITPNLLPKPLLDGLIILTCLPTTVNMAVLLTGRAGGNVASALANAVFGNLFGIFATPALLMHFFGTMIELPFLQMVLKLCNKVLIPVAIGQALRFTPAKDFFTRNKKQFKSLQEMILIGLVWNAFCNAFTNGIGIEVTHGFILLFMLSSLHIGSLLFLFKFFGAKFLNLSKGDVIAAAFTTSHKTLAAGLPLVNTIFEGNPNLAAYCAPIMFIHPLQLIIGSIFAEKLAKEGEGN